MRKVEQSAALSFLLSPMLFLFIFYWEDWDQSAVLRSVHVPMPCTPPLCSRNTVQPRHSAALSFLVRPISFFVSSFSMGHLCRKTGTQCWSWQIDTLPRSSHHSAFTPGMPSVPHSTALSAKTLRTYITCMELNVSKSFITCDFTSHVMSHRMYACCHLLSLDSRIIHDMW